LDEATLLLSCAALSVGIAMGLRMRRAPVKVKSEAEPQLRRARALLNAMPDTWLVIDGQEQVVELHFAPRPGSLAPVPLLRGQRIDTFFSKAVIEKVRSARVSCLKEQREEVFEFDMHVRGEARAAQGRMLPLYDDDVVLVIRDVSERKMTERALEETRQVARAMLDARTEAFARLSHDVRNQMTGVLTMTDMLLAQANEATGRRYLETIQRCGDNIVELVNNMMDLSRLERGSLSLRPSVVDLPRLLAECLELSRAYASPRTELTCSVASDAPEHVQIDAGRLRQVLTNLLHNAAKFTSEGSIHVELAGHDAENFKLVVRDTGRGISPEALPHVFDAYFQAQDTQPPDKLPGSGLGLAIVQSLTRAMGGDVTVESTLGQGTCFTVVLPRGPSATEPVEKREAQATRVAREEAPSRGA
jgi:signal transduction histidine kinase